MTTNSAYCDHCSISFVVADGFPVYCPQCGAGGRFEEVSAELPVHRERHRKWWRAIFSSLGKIGELSFHGTNLTVLMVLIVVAMVLFSLPRDLPKFVLHFMLGITVLVADWSIRRWQGVPLSDFDRGGLLFYFPLWIWGLIWLFVGVIQGVIWLIEA
jgi:hypothetical protein